jgi:hypothetical protein
MAFTKVLLSGSTSGKQIKVAATATAGTLIHTAHATALDEIWIEAHNSSASPVLLTIEWGGVASPDDLIQVTIPSKSGYMWVVQGNPLTGALVVRAFAASANVILISGYVNRIT